VEPENHTFRLLIEMRAEMRARFDAIEERFTGVDARFDAVDARFDAVDARFDAMDRRMDILEDIARDTAARVRMQGRMLRNLNESKRKQGDRLDDLERRVTTLERKGT
jgi:chromosome segregation ATPase